MTGITLISTLYNPEPIIPSIHKYSPSKVILLRGSKATEGARKTLDESEKLITRLFKGVAKIEPVEVDSYDIYKIAKRTTELIEREQEEGNRIIVNVTGGRKTMSLGVLFGCYARPELVEGINYTTEEENQFIELPKLSLGVTERKRVVLEAIAEGLSIGSIATKLKRTRGMIYAHLKELRDSGYIDENFKLTTAGKIALL
jgi:CRISPR-associated protein Csa3